jgi:hypothetical protein
MASLLVAAEQFAQGEGSAHVRYQAPLALHHRQRRLRRRDAEVRAQGDLQPAAPAAAVDGGDDRHRQAAPADAGPLGQVGLPGQPLPQQPQHPAAVVHGGFHVQAGAEIHAGAAQYDCAQVAGSGQLPLHARQRLEHGEVQRVVLVRAVQLDARHTFADRQFDSFGHRSPLLLSRFDSRSC